MINIKELTLEELKSFLQGFGEPAYRARQIWNWLYIKKAASFEEMTDLKKELRIRLAQEFIVPGLILLDKVTSRNSDTVKFLFALPDEEIIESVLMKYVDDKMKYTDGKMQYINSKGERLSVCLSTQAGCPLKCSFCASGVGVFKRNLLFWEIIGQFIEVERSSAERIGNIVFMGIGEPLMNYAATIKAIRFFHETLGIGMRHITVSTSGLSDKIRALADEHMPIHLAVSLHAPDNELRTKLMPINKRFSVESIISACQYYYKVNKRRITFEYVLIDGVNDSPKQASKLLKLLAGVYCLINLIPLNYVKEFSYRPSPPNRIKEFKKILENGNMGDGNIKVTLRAKKGDEMDAACGQLRRRSLKE